MAASRVAFHLLVSVGEKDPVAFKFNPPVSLGAYKLKDYDTNGKWYLWERREDWQRTSIARLGEVSVKSLSEKPYKRHPYAAYTDA